MGVLTGHLVVYLAGWRGALCGKILAEAGADVVVVESRGGNEGRRHPPFLSGARDVDRASGYWEAFAAGMRSVAVDLSRPDGREVLHSLVRRASFLVESLKASELQELGLTHGAASCLNPELITVSITPCGRDAPDDTFDLDGLGTAAAAGFVYTTGVPERPPVMIGGEQAFLHASAYAATGALLSHRWRRLSGEGSHVDASAQEALVLTLGVVMPAWHVRHEVSKRLGNSFPGQVVRRGVWRCKDGFIDMVLPGRLDEVLAWAEAWGDAQAATLRVDLAGIGPGLEGQQRLLLMESEIEQFFAKYSREELWQVALERSVMLYPVQTLQEAVKSDPHRDRGFFAPVELPGYEDRISYPTRLLPGTQSNTFKPAPAVGADTCDVLADYGFADDEIEALWYANVI